MIHGDLSGAGGELVKGVEDTALAAEGTVMKAGAAAVAAVAGAASTAVGGEQLAKWRADFGTRSSMMFAEAETMLATPPFPPAKQP